MNRSAPSGKNIIKKKKKALPFHLYFPPFNGTQPIPGKDEDNLLGDAKEWALAHRGDLRNVLHKAPAFYKTLGFGLVCSKSFLVAILEPVQKKFSIGLDIRNFHSFFTVLLCRFAMLSYTQSLQLTFQRLHGMLDEYAFQFN